MKMSRRSKRMDRRHQRNKGHATINIISMIDMLTVLVLFLLVNSGDMQHLPSTKAIKLPESTALKSPKEAIIITVNNRDIVAQGRRVAPVDETIASADDVIPGLLAELQYQASKNSKIQSADEDNGGDITIMGDKQIPYILLKRIMVTCTLAGYTHISLAVMHKTTEG